MGLDKNRTSIGYQLGRLFAVLEKIQEEANPGLNATIRDRFYGAASSTPVTVFGRLLNLQKHHLGKITNRGKVIFFEGMASPKVSEVIAKESGARTAQLNPLEGLSEEEIKEGADYFSVMRQNAQEIQKALTE